MHISEPRLAALATALQTAKVDLFVQPMADEFQGEYTPACAARLPWLTDFTGSAGMGAFWANPNATRRHSLFVDGRYTLQAAQQVSSSVEVIHTSMRSFIQWLESSITPQENLVIGFDPWLITQRQLEAWKKATASLPVRWQPLTPNPVDTSWHDRPAMPAEKVTLHPLSLAGESYADKRAALLDTLQKTNTDAMILTLPDGVNWLLNLRGNDIPYNPLLLSYLVLHRTGDASLFIHPRPLGDDVEAYLTAERVTLQDVHSIWNGSARLGLTQGARVLIDPTNASHGWWPWLQAHGISDVTADDPTLLPKACKNTVELEGIRAAHRRDGLALTRFLCWLDRSVDTGKLPTELEVVERLEQMRAQDPTYRGPSFATIAGAGPHGAIVHYRADAASNRRLARGELFLLDSGGQYPDGTTDVTRTIAIGNPSDAIREHFTRVLKGHIALARAVFPRGTSGSQLDILARQYLWEVGLDYDHGTGHGVGAFLCVHEGPQRIGKRGGDVALRPGMILSNEPGYYADHSHGIRIENLVAVVTAEHRSEAPFYSFETLTLAPIDTRLINVPLLSSDERNWLNSYHQRVYKTHATACTAEEKSWLKKATQAV